MSPPLAITAADISQLFEKVIKRGPKPCMSDCRDIATWLNENNIPDPSRVTEDQEKSIREKHRRLTDAFRLIQQEARAFRDSHTEQESGFCCLSCAEQAELTNLEAALRRGRFLLAPPPQGWERKFSPLAFGFAMMVLIALRRSGSTATSVSANTQAAIFTEKALAKIGWPVKRTDIANLWHDWMADPAFAARVHAEIEQLSATPPT